MTSDLAARLEALESHIAHQDAAIEDLNATILTQWRTIDALARELAAFGDRLRDLSDREVGQPEAPPPRIIEAAPTLYTLKALASLSIKVRFLT